MICDVLADAVADIQRYQDNRESPLADYYNRPDIKQAMNKLIFLMELVRIAFDCNWGEEEQEQHLADVMQGIIDLDTKNLETIHRNHQRKHEGL